MLAPRAGAWWPTSLEHGTVDSTAGAVKHRHHWPTAAFEARGLAVLPPTSALRAGSSASWACSESQPRAWLGRGSGVAGGWAAASAGQGISPVWGLMGLRVVASQDPQWHSGPGPPWWTWDPEPVLGARAHAGEHPGHRAAGPHRRVNGWALCRPLLPAWGIQGHSLHSLCCLCRFVSERRTYSQGLSEESWRSSGPSGALRFRTSREGFLGPINLGGRWGGAGGL